ncbi:hypothetical protein HGRIS_011444 [Hohenbuehelia grisea]|uniref:Alpha/beta hydrolase fold-3 domain-containing protein n=1 Tax=Hohenbuehelia grisea TaxID=104357 RepID=A0ABR3JVX7_9AGAR
MAITHPVTNEDTNIDPEFEAIFSSLPPADTPDEGDVGLALSKERFNAVLIPLVMENYWPLLPDHTAYRVWNHKIPVEGGKIKIRCVMPTPAHADETFPLLIWYHGGGWMFGTLEMDDYHLRIVCVALRISIVNVEYRLAPEHPFPTGLDDSFSALKWAAENQSQLCADINKGFIVGGQSAGANLATIVAHLARDDPFFDEYPLTGQLLQYPPLIHPDAYPETFKPALQSMDRNADAPFLGRVQIKNIYNALNASPTDPRVSPLLFPSHHKLPPAYIQACGLDPLCDEDILYAKLLEASGVPSKLDVYPGLPHGFHLFFPKLTASEKIDHDFQDGIKWLLNARGGPRMDLKGSRSDGSSG